MIINVNEVLAEPEEDSRLEHASSCRLDSKRIEKERMEISNKEVHDIRYLNICVLHIINKHF